MLNVVRRFTSGNFIRVLGVLVVLAITLSLLGLVGNGYRLGIALNAYKLNIRGLS